MGEVIGHFIVLLYTIIGVLFFMQTLNEPMREYFLDFTGIQLNKPWQVLVLNIFSAILWPLLLVAVTVFLLTVDFDELTDYEDEDYSLDTKGSLV